MDSNSYEIIDIVRDVTSRISERYIAKYQRGVMFVHGSSVYVKEVLDKMTQSEVTSDLKYPIIVLFTPFDELRNDPKLYTRASVSVMIANGSDREWDNDQREEYSFKGILRPIYNEFIDELRKEPRLRHLYNGTIPHRYSENYSYGRYGATDANGEMLSDSIDAINLKSLELEVKPNKNCTR